MELGAGSCRRLELPVGVKNDFRRGLCVFTEVLSEESACRNSGRGGRSVADKLTKQAESDIWDSAGPCCLLCHLKTPKTPHILPSPPFSQEHKMARVSLPKGSCFSHLVFKHLLKKDAFLL